MSKEKYRVENKVCVYTVVINDYDFVLPPAVTDDNIDYILFTDNQNIKVKGWQVKAIDSGTSKMTASKINRYYKFFPNKFLSDYEMSLYIDGNISIVGSLSPLFVDFETSGAKIGLCLHPTRNTVKEEVEACIQLNKVKSGNHLRTEYNKYLESGFTDCYGLTENNVILRFHNDNTIIEAMELWWECLQNSAGRDQISFPFVRERLQLNEKLFSFNVRVTNPYLKIYPHRKNNLLLDLKNYLYARGLSSKFHEVLSVLYSFPFKFYKKIFTLRGNQ